MKSVTITETKNHLSALLDRVRAGETILILDRGLPVARLEPAWPRSDEEQEGRLARLERRGLLKRGSSGTVEEILAREPPRPRSGASALEALLDERRGGR